MSAGAQSRGFGVAAGLDPAVATPLAARCEELGYASMWSNDHPMAGGLETLSAFAAGTERLDLGVAVAALDRHSPAELAARIDELGLDRGRLWLGVGSGFSERPLSAIREALPALREALPGIRLVLAAMGPRMSALAGSSFEGAFLNWVTPEFARESRGRVHRSAEAAGREPPPVLGYVRCAVGPDAEQRLLKEEGFYRELHDGYRRQFERLGAAPGTVGVARADPRAVAAPLHAYDGLDVVVVRGLASAELGSMGAVAEAAAPRG